MENDREPTSPSSSLRDEEKERIREEERRAAEEHRFRESVRRDVRRENPARSAWGRVQRVLRLEPGAFAEIGSDPVATSQGLLVFAIATCVGSLLLGPLLLLAIPVSFVGCAIAAGLLCLAARLFSTQVPEYVQWLRAMWFASVPGALGIVPLIGGLVGGIYTVVLQVVATRDLARISTGAAIVSWLIAIMLPALVLVTVVVAFVGSLVTIALGELFGWDF